MSWSEAREWCGNSNDAEKRHLVSFEVPDELDHVYRLLINAFSGYQKTTVIVLNLLYCNSLSFITCEYSVSILLK